MTKTGVRETVTTTTGPLDVRRGDRLRVRSAHPDESGDFYVRDIACHGARIDLEAVTWRSRIKFGVLRASDAARAWLARVWATLTRPLWIDAP